MSKTVNIKEVILYCNIDNNEEFYFYFNMNDFKFYSRNNLKSDFGYDDSLFDDENSLLYIYNIVPMFEVDENSKIIEFLLQENNKKIIRTIKRMNHIEIRKLVQTMFDYDYGFGCRWTKYIHKYKTDTAVEWCKKNNISYTE